MSCAGWRSSLGGETLSPATLRRASRTDARATSAVGKASVRGNAVEIVLPESLDVVRAYYTGIDLRVVTQGGPAQHRELARRIKLLALLKGHVIVAASHLVESMESFPFLRENPALLSHGILVPALRKEFATVEQFVEHQDPKRTTSWVGIPSVLEAARLVDATAPVAVQWDVEQASAFFARLVIDHMSDRRSLLRSLMPDVSDATVACILERLHESARLSRDDIANSLLLIPSKASREGFRRYADLAYYIAGAHAVQSIGILPQENLGRIDYGDGVTVPRLSEWDIFFDHCASAIFAASGPRILPEDLDKLTVDEILAVRGSWIGPRFREKYQRLLSLVRGRVEVLDPHNIVLRLEELDTIAQELAAEYELAAMREARLSKLMKSGMSVISLVLSGAFESADYVLTAAEFMGDWIDSDPDGEGRIARVRSHVQAARQRAGDLLATNVPLTRFLELLTDRVRAKA